MSFTYGPLSPVYDRLTQDVDYKIFADIIEAQLNRVVSDGRLLLDLCCGTGTLSWEMAERGYEIIGVDGSDDMLIEAREKSRPCIIPPMFICQQASELDLYGTVDAAFSTLDSINYIQPSEINEVFKRLSLFIRPDGMLIFDIRTPEWLREMDGFTSVDEDDKLFCVWRADFSEEESCLIYGLDMFEKRGKLWQRFSEEHIEYSYSPELLESLLTANGFKDISFTAAPPELGDGRMFVMAIRQ